MTYYVDSVYGNDSNDGVSRQTAFRTIERVNQLVLTGGDSVLFKADGTYAGNLHPRRQRDGAMVRFGRYGVGEKPRITAAGGGAMELVDFDCVEVEDLFFTNPDGVFGVYIVNMGGGALQHIHIRNCAIHHVNDNRSTFGYESGGIICGSFSENEPGWFEDLLLEDNDIRDVCRTGILLSGFWANRPTKLWGKNEYVSDTENWWPSKGVVVRSNYIERTGGDGIVLIGTDHAVMEWNRVFHVMTNPVPPCANAGIWPQSSNDCLIQYNEVGYCHKPDQCSDAQGIDVDLSCRNTVIQYNYTHDNEGGALLLCELEDTKDSDNFRGTIYRNNLSVNDGGVKGELIAMVSSVRGVTIENNTFYSTGNVERMIELFSFKGDAYAADVTVRRNAFISNGRGNQFHLEGGRSFTFEDNLYWGACRQVPAEDHSAVVADPCLKAEGACGDGMGVTESYIPANQDLILKDAPAGDSAFDLLGRSTDGVAYIGAILPASEV